MRWCVVLAMLLVCPPAYGQRTEAKRSVGGELLLPKFRVVRLDKPTLYVVSHELMGTYYKLVDVNGKQITLNVETVIGIFPITEEEAERVADEAKTRASAPLEVATRGPRVAARTTPRTFARTASPGTEETDPEIHSPSTTKPSGNFPRPRKRRYASTSWWSPGFVDQSNWNYGTTATGIPLHVGPRGGVYHITSGGNKAYHSR
jgi:hypothetical protein